MHHVGTEPRLTVVSRLGVEKTEAQWLKPILSAWPGHATPEGRIVSYDTLCKELSPHDPCEPGQRALPSQVVVALASSKDEERDLYRLLDALRRSITPAVLVMRDELAREADTAQAAEMGVAVLGWETPIADIARALATLLERQPLIDSMSRDVRLAQLSQRSIAGELDKLHRELHEAAQMQKQFVQRAVPFIDGLNIGVIFRPATYVSGDLFDVDRLDEHHVSVFLADAVGHGVPAAMLTLFISRALPKIDGKGGHGRIVPPAEALARLNREFCARPGPGDRFATAVYAVIDTRTMTATIAGAGHPAALVVESGRFDPQKIESEGPLLGVFPDAEFEQVEVELGPTGSLVLYTDGFEVAYPDASAGPSRLKIPTEFYVDRLVRLAMRSHERADLAGALLDFEHELDNQLGSLHRPDDVTALVISADAAVGAVTRAA
ncbi:MAG: SpoIIE family protein phosphatase [Phycisphaeraceae bacterium]|nr:MAG: SpoIIE family protein phosphatase [Phycisphaeraceae bacterium]